MASISSSVSPAEIQLAEPVALLVGDAERGVASRRRARGPPRRAARGRRRSAGRRRSRGAPRSRRPAPPTDQPRAERYRRGSGRARPGVGAAWWIRLVAPRPARRDACWPVATGWCASIARGGMADVFEAEDERLQRRRRREGLPGRAAGGSGALRREVSVLAALDHPGPRRGCSTPASTTATPSSSSSSSTARRLAARLADGARAAGRGRRARRRDRRRARLRPRPGRRAPRRHPGQHPLRCRTAAPASRTSGSPGSSTPPASPPPLITIGTAAYMAPEQVQGARRHRAPPTSTPSGSCCWSSSPDAAPSRARCTRWPSPASSATPDHERGVPARGGRCSPSMTRPDTRAPPAGRRGGGSDRAVRPTGPLRRGDRCGRLRGGHEPVAGDAPHPGADTRAVARGVPRPGAAAERAASAARRGVVAVATAAAAVVATAGPRGRPATARRAAVVHGPRDGDDHHRAGHHDDRVARRHDAPPRATAAQGRGPGKEAKEEGPRSRRRDD